MLLKAAETTKSAGATHFIVISSADASRSDIVASPGYAQTNFIGKVAFTTYNPGSVHQIMKPGQDAYIRVLNVPEGVTPPDGAISADEIVKFIGSRVERD